MAQSSGGRMVFTAIRGRDGGSRNPLNIPDGLAAECLNVELDGTTIGTKRLGASEVTQNNSWPSAGSMKAILVNTPADPTLTEIWGLAYNGTGFINYLPVNSPAWVTPTAVSTCKPNLTPVDANGVHFNGKFYMAFSSSDDRLKVWDPVLALVRRVGLSAPGAAPTVANTGSGSYAAVERWYQQSYRIKNGSIVVAEGERSASTAGFTPSGSGTHARITKAASIGESETHWVLWGSETGASGPFYQIAETAVGTTTYDDSAAPSSYDDGIAAQKTGTFTVPTSGKFLLNDAGNRLLMAGQYTGTTHGSRVWFFPALGSLGRGDDERILQQDTGAADDIKHWVDINEKSGGNITALGMLPNGHPVVFKKFQIWRLVPTGDVAAPYVPRFISLSVGCVHQHTVHAGVDEVGQACLYFGSIKGPYRLYGDGRLQYIGFDVEDVWRDAVGTVPGAPETKYSATWYQGRQQYWVFSRGPSGRGHRMRFHAPLGRPDDSGRIRGGWAHDDNATNTVGLTLGLTALPYSPGFLGNDTETPRPHALVSDGTILRCDDHNATQDDGSDYQAYVTTRPETPAGLGTRVTTGHPVLAGKCDIALASVTITVNQIRNYAATADDSRAATVSVSSTRASLLVEQGAGMPDCDVIAFQIGDGSALNSLWTADALVVPWQQVGDVVRM